VAGREVEGRGARDKPRGGGRKSRGVAQGTSPVAGPVRVGVWRKGTSPVASPGSWPQETCTVAPVGAGWTREQQVPWRAEATYSGFRSHAPSPLSTLLLNLGAEAAVDFGELAAVLDAVVGQGEGFLLLSGLQI
jgi:hypothetical protein